MRLDSVRALKEQFTSFQRSRAGGRVRPSFGLGVAPGDDGDYLLAVHVQDRNYLDSPLLREIRDAANGELDVRYVGRLVPRTDPTVRTRPIRPGVSVGHKAISTGTVGAFVRRRDDPAWYLLSNNHVLANQNRGEIGDEVIQPGSEDGGRLGIDGIGLLADYVELNPLAPNHVDCAIAKLHDGIEVQPDSLPELGAISGTVSIDDVTEVKRVAKVGRTTGLTYGRVIGSELDIVVDFDIGPVQFQGQIAIASTDRPFSESGDSGALIVTTDAADRYRAFALLFCGIAGGEHELDDVTYGNPIAAVLDEIRAEVPW